MLSKSSPVRSGLTAAVIVASVSSAVAIPVLPNLEPAVAGSSGPDQPILVWGGEGRGHGNGAIWPRFGGGHVGGGWGGGHWGHGGGWGGGWGSGFALGLGLGLATRLLWRRLCPLLRQLLPGLL
jgi:hypothetical protein